MSTLISLIGGLLFATPGQAATVERVELAGDRLVIRFDEAVKRAQSFLLAGPDRIAIDVDGAIPGGLTQGDTILARSNMANRQIPGERKDVVDPLGMVQRRRPILIQNVNETDILFSIGNANLCRAPLGPDTRGDAKFRQGFLQGFFIEAPFRQLALGSKGHQSCPDAVMRHLFLFQRDVFRIGQDQMRRLAEGPIGQ